MLITQGSLVRAQLDPPNFQCEKPDWGISSAGRAPALQAGGRRFDPVILHQDSSDSKFIASLDAIIVGSLQYKSTLHQSAFVLRRISIGCSLKIHRVEISIADGMHFKCTVPSAII